MDNREFNIALDAFGGDNAPQATVAGAKAAIVQAEKQGITGLNITLVGNRRLLEDLLEGSEDSIDILDVPAVESADYEDRRDIDQNADSPIRTALRFHHEGRFDAVVSAGPTAAQVVASLLELEKCPRITRPAIGSLLPTSNGFSFLIDVGATLVATAHHLVQFAAMGHVYAEQIIGIENPRIAVINVGQERDVGDRTVVEAYRLLSESGFNFVGFAEGRDIPAGFADIYVTNGMIGNIILKYTEGLPALVRKLISPDNTPELNPGFLDQFDFQNYGGEPLLGLNGVSIICHGASNERGIASAVMQAVKIVRVQLHAKLENFLLNHFESYFSQVKYLRSFRRSFTAVRRRPKESGSA